MTKRERQKEITMIKKFVMFILLSESTLEMLRRMGMIPSALQVPVWALVVEEVSE